MDFTRVKLDHVILSGAIINLPTTQLVKMKKKWIALHPVTFGVFVGILIAAILIAMELSFPGFYQAWQRRNTLVQAIWFTIVLFVVSAVRLWRFRRRGAFSFWASLIALWTLHVIGILIYYSYFGALLLRQWIYVLVCEAFVFVFVADWITRRFGRTSRR